MRRMLLKRKFGINLYFMFKNHVIFFANFHHSDFAFLDIVAAISLGFSKLSVIAIYYFCRVICRVRINPF